MKPKTKITKTTTTDKKRTKGTDKTMSDKTMSTEVRINARESAIDRYTATPETVETSEPLDASNIVKAIEAFVNDYVTLKDQHYSLPIALYILGTYCFLSFDAYPYMIITSSTKRSGKTRLSEMIGFCCSNPAPMSAMTAATYFRIIEERHPTVIFDEAEKLNSESSGDLRSVLNVGYRKGQTIPRTSGETVKDYDTYCPKIFVLIGDTFDTLRDRSIMIMMRRAEPRRHFRFQTVKQDGAAIREAASKAVESKLAEIERIFAEHDGLPFLQDRDEEIWTSLFVLAQVFCPERITELQVAASDMAAEKTVDARSYLELEKKAESETEATTYEYGKKMLTDVWSIFMMNGAKHMPTEQLLHLLREIPTSPWRKFRGTGIDHHDLANLLSRFPAVKPVQISFGYGRKGRKNVRGYRRVDIEKAMQTV